MTMTLTQQLDELMEFDGARILRVRQSDSDLHIATYQAGGEYWVTLNESNGEDEFSSVYVSGDGLRALKEALDALPIDALPTKGK